MILLYTTFPNIEVAQKICKDLILAKNIKCANLQSNGTSIYAWQGEVKTESEVYCYLKTTADQTIAVEEFLRKHHPYKNFCLIELEPNYVVNEFREWIEN